MHPDIEKYRHHVEGFDLTEEQKVEMIHIVWCIMENFVDRAFGIDAVQQVSGLGAAKGAEPGPLVIELAPITTQPDHFADASRSSTGKRRKRKSQS